MVSWNVMVPLPSSWMLIFHIIPSSYLPSSLSNVNPILISSPALDTFLVVESMVGISNGNWSVEARTCSPLSSSLLESVMSRVPFGQSPQIPPAFFIYPNPIHIYPNPKTRVLPLTFSECFFCLGSTVPRS